MGRIKTTLLKRKTKELLKAHGEKFTADFNTNKIMVGKCTDVSSKKLRNIIAGYMSRLKRKEA